MARPANPNKLTTPISILKSQKARMRVYAEPSKKRKGNESDEEVLERILTFYEQHHNVTDKRPKPTYNFSSAN